MPKAVWSGSHHAGPGSLWGSLAFSGGGRRPGRASYSSPATPGASRVDTAVEQFRLAEQDKGEHIACLEARKHFAWYLRGVPYSGYYKEKISHISTMADILDIAAGVKRDLR